MEITITISDSDLKILQNDLLDVSEWINGAVNGKINNCWSRFQQEWTTRLMNDESFTDPIPSNREDFIALVTSRPDYLSRSQREETSFEG